MTDCIDIHTHIVPEKFPSYAGKGRDVEYDDDCDRDPSSELHRVLQRTDAHAKRVCSVAR